MAFEETLRFGVSCCTGCSLLACYQRNFYLLTFCPPGPLDLENVISDRLRGMVSGFRSASHLRAAPRSSSEYSVGPRFEANALIFRTCGTMESWGNLRRRWKSILVAVVCKTESDVGGRLKVWHVIGGRCDVQVDLK